MQPSVVRFFLDLASVAGVASMKRVRVIISQTVEVRVFIDGLYYKVNDLLRHMNASPPFSSFFY